LGGGLFCFYSYWEEGYFVFILIGRRVILFLFLLGGGLFCFYSYWEEDYFVFILIGRRVILFLFLLGGGLFCFYASPPHTKNKNKITLLPIRIKTK
jgi:hypothetical protein